MMFHTLWFGPKPPHIDVCLRSIARCCGGEHRHRDQLIQIDHPKFAKLQHKCWQADLHRLHVLSEFGGWWIDADTVMLRKPDIEVGEAPCVYMEWSEPPVRIPNGYIYMTREFARIAYEVALGRLHEWKGNDNMDWCWLGEQVITPLIKAIPGCIKMPLETFMPIEIDKGGVERFFDSDDFRPHIRPCTVAFGLNHSWMVRVKGPEMSVPIRDMAGSPLLIHKLISYADQENRNAGCA